MQLREGLTALPFGAREEVLRRGRVALGGLAGRATLQHHEAHPVRDDVMEFAGDAGPLLRHDLPRSLQMLAFGCLQKRLSMKGSPLALPDHPAETPRADEDGRVSYLVGEADSAQERVKEDGSKHQSPTDEGRFQGSV